MQNTDSSNILIQSLPELETGNITLDPLPGSEKVYVQSLNMPSVSVPMRQVNLTDGTHITLYDTSGPYTDANASIDVHKGLPNVRSAWLDDSSDHELYQGRDTKPEDNGLESKDKAFQFYNPHLQRQPRRAKAGRNVSQMHLSLIHISEPTRPY